MTEAAMPLAAGVTQDIAGFWRRVGAALIDGIILSSVNRVAMVLDPTLFDFSLPPEFQTKWTTWAALGLVYWAYFAIPESTRKQASLGKFLLRMRVVDLEGRRISLVRATVRSWPFWLPTLLPLSNELVMLATLVAVIACLVAGFTPRRQGLHDLMAKTLVLRGRA